ncbi:hypothetical protein [Streptomyces scabiei]|uniref:hypothetical protein n=1 Tax=Streptomyces scabiei TaxID=1930 RepID=UPI0038F7E00E
MKIVSGAKHARLQDRCDRLVREAADQQAIISRQATEIARLRAEFPNASEEDIAAWEARAKAHDTWKPPAGRDAWEARPVDGASGRPLHPAAELRRALDRCQQLQALLDGRGTGGAS